MFSLSLKYRPSSFQDMQGQLHTTQSLKNALELDHISHAYLFFGSRGVGKTSAARILAKCLNCVEGPSEKPCEKCDNCIEISQSSSPDVIEMDAASNRGIESIRELRENVRFSTMKSKYKVYIIDEVHMLTNESFNALLKTLEEPPEHVIFILATTEKHKIPETILSRCQNFSFRKFSVQEIKQRLEFILSSEKIDFIEEALIPIAQKAEGSMRDAISILDQVLAFTASKKIEFSSVKDVLSLVEFEIHLEFLKAFLKEDKKAALFLIERLYNEGYNLRQFIWDFLEFIKNACLVKMNILGQTSEILTQSQLNEIKEFVQNWDESNFQLLFEEMYQLYSNWSIFQSNKSSEIRISIEMTIMKIFIKLDQPSVSGLMQKIHSLKNALKSRTSFHPNSLEIKKEENIKNNESNKDNESENRDPGMFIQKEFMGKEEHDFSKKDFFKN